jgi:plastocyanin
LAATQFAPFASTVPAGSNLTFVNKEVTNYPMVIGNHNVIPDHVGKTFPGAKPFPASSDLIAPGEKWTCTSASSGLSCTGLNNVTTAVAPGLYAIACGLHPNQMHALITVQ